MIPIDGGEPSKSPVPPLADSADDETFEDRLRHAIVRHFRFAWRELAHVRQAERGQKAESERGAVATPAEPPKAAEGGEGLNATPVAPSGNGAGVAGPSESPSDSPPAQPGEGGPILPPSRPPF